MLVTNTAVTRHCTNIDLLIFSNEVYNTLSLKDIHFFQFFTKNLTLMLWTSLEFEYIYKNKTMKKSPTNY